MNNIIEAGKKTLMSQSPFGTFLLELNNQTNEMIINSRLKKLEDSIKKFRTI